MLIILDIKNMGFVSLGSSTKIVDYSFFISIYRFMDIKYFLVDTLLFECGLPNYWNLQVQPIDQMQLFYFIGTNVQLPDH